MENVKYTKVQKLTDLETILNQVETKDFDIAALIEFVQAERAALDRKAAKAKETAAAKKTEIDELGHAVLSVLTSEPMTRDEIFALVDNFDETVSVAKVGARLTRLVELGRVEKTEVKTTSASGKKTIRMAYNLIVNE